MSTPIVPCPGCVPKLVYFCNFCKNREHSQCKMTMLRMARCKKHLANLCLAGLMFPAAVFALRKQRLLLHLRPR
eukprot:676637-Amphidinium_carterae.1